MRVYLVQHGHATPKDQDPDRPLAPRGRDDVQKMALFLQRVSVRVAAVWHSGKTRTRQTAELLAPSLHGAPAVDARDGLGPNDPVAPVRQALEADGEDRLIVGHLPFLGRLASALVAGAEDADAVSFQKGGVVCLERHEAGAWRLRWMVTPELV